MRGNVEPVGLQTVTLVPGEPSGRPRPRRPRKQLERLEPRSASVFAPPPPRAVSARVRLQILEDHESALRHPRGHEEMIV